MTETHAKNLGFSVTSSVCPHHFGFLGQRSKGMAIPDECFTCEKIIECMAFRPKEPAAEPETKLELSAIDETKDLAREFGKENKRKRPQKNKAKHHETSRQTTRASNYDFTVESPGAIYAHWSGTVLIGKETLRNWGEVKEVDIENERGKKVTCKAYPIEDIEKGVIQVPDKVQLKLEVKKGWTVKVKPAGSS